MNGPASLRQALRNTRVLIAKNLTEENLLAYGLAGDGVLRNAAVAAIGQEAARHPTTVIVVPSGNREERAVPADAKGGREYEGAARM